MVKYVGRDDWECPREKHRKNGAHQTQGWQNTQRTSRRVWSARELIIKRNGEHKWPRQCRDNRHHSSPRRQCHYDISTPLVVGRIVIYECHLYLQLTQPKSWISVVDDADVEHLRVRKSVLHVVMASPQNLVDIRREEKHWIWHMLSIAFLITENINYSTLTISL